jgi:hypothetical protein
MDVMLVRADAAQGVAPPPDAPCTDGFYWLDLTHEEFVADPEGLRERIHALTGVKVFDLHLQDAGNLLHPSYFDATSEYDMLIFRKLAPGEKLPLEPLPGPAPPPGATARRSKSGAGHRLQEIVTRPITFFVFERLLVTVRNRGSRTIEQVRARLLDFRARVLAGAKPGGGRGAAVGAQAVGGDAAANGVEVLMTRLPQHPGELMLRLLNGMVDRYLDLRQALTDRVDVMQRELLDPQRNVFDWTALLDARIELRKLENLCEEQLDALQELRDAYIESTPQPQQSDAHLVRIADVIEHINRVLNHARRLESSIETAVQLHFSATAHRTNQIVRALTVITVVFGVLTLIAGVWGMNFQHIPLSSHPQGFAILCAIMLLLAAALLGVFWFKRFLSDG